MSRKSRLLRLGLENCDDSTLIVKVAPRPPRSRRILSWSRRDRLGLEICAVSASASKSRRLHHGLKVALYPPRSRETVSWSRRLQLDLEISAVSISVVRNYFLVAPSPGHTKLGRDILVAPTPLRSRKSRRIIVVAKVWKWQVLVAKVWTCLISVWKVWTCQKLVAKMWST